MPCANAFCFHQTNQGVNTCNSLEYKHCKHVRAALQIGCEVFNADARWMQTNKSVNF